MDNAILIDERNHVEFHPLSCNCHKCADVAALRSSFRQEDAIKTSSPSGTEKPCLRKPKLQAAKSEVDAERLAINRASDYWQQP